MESLRLDAKEIMAESIAAVLPESSVEKAINNMNMKEKIIVIAIGKAAWNMACAAQKKLKNRIVKGLIITKYGHSKGNIESFEMIESGHPLPDENSIYAARKAIDLVSSMDGDTTLLMLFSGGGSSLFELPLEGISLKDIVDITEMLLKRGANIDEINAVRKHLSAVKGGRFAEFRRDIDIRAVILSDVIGNAADIIASGPVTSDGSTAEEALGVLEKYNIYFEQAILDAISIETPKSIKNCEYVVTGSVEILCEAAVESCLKKGYRPLLISSAIVDEARHVGKQISEIAKQVHAVIPQSENKDTGIALIAGGETIVKVIGSGKGGRNQEAALAAAIELEGHEDIVFFSIGSDGTDGPTDAAGGLVDGLTIKRIEASGMDAFEELNMNNAYNALKSANDLIMTGPTGTNVNDLMMALIRKS